MFAPKCSCKMSYYSLNQALYSNQAPKEARETFKCVKRTFASKLFSKKLASKHSEKESECVGHRNS